MANENPSDSKKQRRKNRTLLGTIQAVANAVKNARKTSNGGREGSIHPISRMTKYQWYMHSGQYRKPSWKHKTRSARTNFISNRKVS